MSEISILITGSRGIIGRHLCADLKQYGRKVRIIEFKGDIRDRGNVKNVFESAGQIDIVINLAAVVAVEVVESQPAKAYAVNVGGVASLLEAISEHQLRPHFFQCSSAHVYSPSEFPISEESPTEPVSEYGRTKKIAEILVEKICTKAGISWCIGRVFSIHDPAQQGSFLRPRIEERLREADIDKPFELRGAESIRDFLTAQQAAAYIAALSVAKYQGMINIGSGQPIQIRDFVQQLAGRELNILPVGKADTLVADITRLKEFEARAVHMEPRENNV